MQVLYTAALTLALCATSVLATTDKYRLIWNSAPESSITVAWCQKDGENARVHYGAANGETKALPQSHGIDHETSYLKIDMEMEF